MKSFSKGKGWVFYWLVLGIFFVFLQVVIGGITRITGSGLSITKWEIVTGILPPLSLEGWESEFDLYKLTPQYEKLNQGMSLSEFKFIYFWEYFHRLWARVMGFVFIIPFIIFYRKGLLDSYLIRNLSIVVLLAAITASFGWIMVASGLIDRPWVNAYKLSFHLLLAIATLWWLTRSSVAYYFKESNFTFSDRNFKIKGYLLFFSFVLIVQLFLGGMMSGMRAALLYPSWPDMNGVFLPSLLLDTSNWSMDNFINYDKSIFFGSLVQFMHRIIAYLLFFLGIGISFKIFKVYGFSFKPALFFVGVLTAQVLLGILTLLYAKGNIPLLFGVLHQAFAIILVISFTVLYLYLTYRPVVKSILI
jgi:heme a synthase